MSLNSPFKFELNARVFIAVSGERGTVIGRAEYVSSENSYYVRYLTTDGSAVESWWIEGALAPDTPLP